jgi:hypothetical protein
MSGHAIGSWHIALMLTGTGGSRRFLCLITFTVHTERYLVRVLRLALLFLSPTSFRGPIQIADTTSKPPSRVR